LRRKTPPLVIIKTLIAEHANQIATLGISAGITVKAATTSRTKQKGQII
jgi:hypothetical protein